MKQTVVEWLVEELRGYDDKGDFIFNGVITSELIEQAKAMHKEEIIEAINKVSENNVKYANMIIASWSQIEGELFMHNKKLAEQYYNETFGGNK
jgi:hypothetical protein